MCWRTPPARSVRLLSGLALSSPARISRLLSGVRSSCDMFEKNSDLYADETTSCSAFSSTSRLARSTSWFLRSTSMFCSARRLACFARSSFELRSSSWRDCSSCACDCDCLSRFSVSVLASIVLSTSPMLSVSWSRNAWWVALKRLNDASSITARTEPSNRIGSTMMFSGCDSPSPELILHVVAGHVGEQDALLLLRALADEAFAEAELGSRDACAPCSRIRPGSGAPARRRRRA